MTVPQHSEPAREAVALNESADELCAKLHEIADDGDTSVADGNVICRAAAMIRRLSASGEAAAELLRKLEDACDNAAGKRSQETYDQMISDPGSEDVLDELDIVRREARIFLNPDLWRRADGKR